MNQWTSNSGFIDSIAYSEVATTKQYFSQTEVDIKATTGNFTFHPIHVSTVGEATTEEVFSFHPLATTTQLSNGGNLVTEATVKMSSSTQKIEIESSKKFELEFETSTIVKSTDFFSENPKNILVTSTETPISTLVPSPTSKPLFDSNDVETTKNDDLNKISTIKHGDEKDQLENTENELHESQATERSGRLIPTIFSTLQTTPSSLNIDVSLTPAPSEGLTKEATVDSYTQTDSSRLDDRNESEDSNETSTTQMKAFLFHSIISVLKANESLEREFNMTLAAELEKREHFMGLPGERSCIEDQVFVRTGRDAIFFSFEHLSAAHSRFFFPFLLKKF